MISHLRSNQSPEGAQTAMSLTGLAAPGAGAVVAGGDMAPSASIRQVFMDPIAPHESSSSLHCSQKLLANARWHSAFPSGPRPLPVSGYFLQRLQAALHKSLHHAAPHTAQASPDLGRPCTTLHEPALPLIMLVYSRMCLKSGLDPPRVQDSRERALLAPCQCPSINPLGLTCPSATPPIDTRYTWCLIHLGPEL